MQLTDGIVHCSRQIGDQTGGQMDRQTDRQTHTQMVYYTVLYVRHTLRLKFHTCVAAGHSYCLLYKIISNH